MLHRKGTAPGGHLLHCRAQNIVLAARIGDILRRGAVRRCEMRKDTHGHKPRQRTGLGHLHHGTLHIVVRRKADAAHARVYFQMHAHRHARTQRGLRKRPRIFQREHRLADAAHGQRGRVLHAGITQNQDGLRNARPAQAHRLAKAGHRKLVRALLLQKRGHHRVAVAVCIGLYHGHHRRIPGPFPHQLKVVPQRAEVHLGPAAPFKFHHIHRPSFIFMACRLIRFFQYNIFVGRVNKKRANFYKNST